MKIEQFYNKNQFVIFEEGKTVFQSYDSTIAEVDDNGNLTLFRDWNYSNTTRKHLYLFIVDYVYKINRHLIDNRQKNKQIQKMIDDGIITFFDKNGYAI